MCAAPNYVRALAARRRLRDNASGSGGGEKLTLGFEVRLEPALRARLALLLCRLFVVSSTTGAVPGRVAGHGGPLAFNPGSARERSGHAPTRPHTRAHAHACTHTHARTHTHTHTHAHIRTHTRAHTHTAGTTRAVRTARRWRVLHGPARAGRDMGHRVVEHSTLPRARKSDNNAHGFLKISSMGTSARALGFSVVFSPVLARWNWSCGPTTTSTSVGPARVSNTCCRPAHGCAKERHRTVAGTKKRRIPAGPGARHTPRLHGETRQRTE